MASMPAAHRLLKPDFNFRLKLKVVRPAARFLRASLRNKLEAIFPTTSLGGGFLFSKTDARASRRARRSAQPPYPKATCQAVPASSLSAP